MKKAKTKYQLSKNAKKTLVEVMPWLALICGSVSFVILLVNFQSILLFSDMTRDLAYAGLAISSKAWILGWASMAFAIAQAGLFIAAIVPLNKRQKVGWNMLLGTVVAGSISALIGVVYDFNVAGVAVTVAGLVVELFALVQVREFYKK